MKIDSIYEEWGKDSEIDKTELGDESIRIPKLHHKYYQIYTAEKMLLRKYDADMRKLKLDKYEFYTMGPNEDTPKDWKLPPRGMILKTDIPMYIEGDKDIIDLSLRIGIQQEKVEFIKSIIDSISKRGFLLKTIHDDRKFMSGG